MAITINVWSDEQEKSVDTKITDVKVFLNNAQITRTGSTNLLKGATFVSFEGIVGNVNEQSIQIEGKGNFTIMSVTYRTNYLRIQESPKEIKILQDSVNFLNLENRKLQALDKVVRDEEAFLKANHSIGGQNTGYKPEDLKAIAEFLRIRFKELYLRQIDISEDIKKNQEKLQRIQNQIQLLNGKTNQATNAIVVAVYSKEPTQATFSLNYVLSDAGWTPIYDLRAVDVNNPIELTYKANVWQNTGEDWKNINFTISSGNPTSGGILPVLNIWYLNFLSPRSYSTIEGVSINKTSRPASKNTAGAYEADDASIPALKSSQFTQTNFTQITTEFEISLPYIIASGGRPIAIDLQVYKLPAEYEYYSVPKIDKDAFLKARISGWDEYPLLPGEANLYFEGTYVGKSYLNANYTNDTLDISLGRDKGISVSRTKVKDFSSKNLIGSVKKESFTWEIAVRNKKKSPINIVIEDQFPISKNEEIEVEITESSKGSVDIEKGFIKWKFDLKPATNKSLRLGYSVKYPKNKIINL